MGRTTSLRQAIKQVFVPQLRDKGFSPDMRHAPQRWAFRKVDPNALYVCDIQWEKYGRPRFVLTFGKCSPKGVIIRGEHFLPGDVFPNDTPEYGLLAPGRRPTTAGWFRQDRPLIQRLVSGSELYAAEDVVLQLVALFAEVEEFWKSGIVGPHIRLVPVPPALAAENVSP